MRLAVIGAGHLGRIHARLLAGMPDVELVGVADPSASAREKATADCGARGFEDYRELLEVIDAVVVATPTMLHHAVALDCLAQGLPTLVEKPIAASLDEADDLVQAAKHFGALLQVGHIERFNPAFTAVKPHLEGPKFIEAVRASGFTFRSTDIGVVLDLMIHDLDAVLSLVRSPLVRVDAMGLAVLGRHEDVANARLEFENGCVAQLSASRVSPTGKRQMQVWAEQAFATIDFAKGTASLIRPSQNVLRRELDLDLLSPIEREEFKTHLFEEHLRIEPLQVETRNALADELTDFVSSIRERRAPVVSGEAGRDALAVAERILDAIGSHAWNGRAAGPTGPLASPVIPILRGPHWQNLPEQFPTRREAG